MLDNSSGSANYSIDKPLFKTDDWKYMIEGSTLQVNADGNFVLDITASIKDTEKQIPKFLNWLVPYTNSEGFVGYIEPNLDAQEVRILFEKGKVYLVEPVQG